MAERAVLHVLPHPGGGGEEYVRLLEGMEGFRFERLYLTESQSPLAAVASLPRAFRRARECDLVQVHGDAASIVCLPLLGRRPTVLTTHGLSLLRRTAGTRNALVRGALGRAVGRSAATICTSAAERDELAAAVGESDKLHVIPNGVEIPEAPMPDAERRTVRESLGLDPSDVAVLWAGALEPHKDPLTFVQAVAAVGPPVVGLLAGDGSMRATVEGWAGDRLRVLGHRDDLDRILSVGDVFALTSEREGLSVVLLEAMANCLPVVVSDRPANIEAAGEDGIVFALGDAGALARALRRLAACSRLREELGFRSRHRVERLYACRRMADATRQLYARVLRG